jgi:hypothetical protein
VRRGVNDHFGALTPELFVPDAHAVDRLVDQDP